MPANFDTDSAIFKQGFTPLKVTVFCLPELDLSHELTLI